MKLTCEHCNSTFKRSPSQSKRSKNHYCSRSCSTSANNLKNPKVKPKGSCKSCGSKITTNRTFCKDCSPRSRISESTTLGEVMYRDIRKSSAFALVRSRARSIAKKLGWDTCLKCGFNKHVEIAHIKPISEFSEDSLLSEVNDKSNLMPLCPNCHWIFDHPEALPD